MYLYAYEYVLETLRKGGRGQSEFCIQPLSRTTPANTVKSILKAFEAHLSYVHNSHFISDFVWNGQMKYHIL